MEQIITIVASEELSELKLSELVGRKGIVKELRYHPFGSRPRGAWIELIGEPYLDEQEWYIPEKSIMQDDNIKARQ